jgi:UDP-N-acetylmuramate dehydrogenase
MIISENFNMQSINTFGIPARAKLFASFDSIDSLKILLQEAKRLNEKLFILGGGSNILLTKDIEGIVLKNEIKGIHVAHETEDHVFVECKAGEIWHDFVLWCLDCDFQGVENLSLIPGTVGASPMQNIGAYGVELKDVFDSLEAIEIDTLQTKLFTKAQCNFGYRESVFKNILKDKYIITSVLFKLNKKFILNTSYGAIQDILKENKILHPTIKNISDTVIQIRESKLPNPKEIGNAGSFFKNPTIATTLYNELKKDYESIPGYMIDETYTKVPAGWLIEQCGWKGFKENNFGVHALQALVLVNYGGAQGDEILQLSEKIIYSVNEKFDILLSAEVNVW